MLICFWFIFLCSAIYFFFFFFNDTATTEIYTLSLQRRSSDLHRDRDALRAARHHPRPHRRPAQLEADRKSTRLNSSHDQISYAVFCLKKKKTKNRTSSTNSEPTNSNTQ